MKSKSLLDHEEDLEKPLKSATKNKDAEHPVYEYKRPELPEQPDPNTVDFSTFTPLHLRIIARQATIQHWNHRSRRSRQIDSGQGYFRSSHHSFQERAGAKHYHQVGLRQRKDLQIDNVGSVPDLPATRVTRVKRKSILHVSVRDAVAHTACCDMFR